MMVYNQKVLNFHWHVTGQNYYEFHLLFERVYQTLEPFEDRLAEHIRGYGRAPGAFAIFLEFSSIKENLSIPDSAAMVVELASDLRILIADLYVCLEQAGEANRQGTLNLLGELCETLDTLTFLLESQRPQYNL